MKQNCECRISSYQISGPQKKHSFVRETEHEHVVVQTGFFHSTDYAEIYIPIVSVLVRKKMLVMIYVDKNDGY